MKYRILIVIFLVGVVLGLAIFQPTQTGAGVVDCYVENELCICQEECLCGDVTVPLEYCNPNA